MSGGCDRDGSPKYSLVNEGLVGSDEVIQTMNLTDRGAMRGGKGEG